jgi:hypothetical protein
MCHEPYDPHRLLERVKSALVDLQWKFGEDAERLTLTMGYGSRHGLYFCVLQVHPRVRISSSTVRQTCSN